MKCWNSARESECQDGMGQPIRGQQALKVARVGLQLCTLVSSTMVMPGHRGRQYMVCGTKGQ